MKRFAALISMLVFSLALVGGVAGCSCAPESGSGTPEGSEAAVAAEDAQAGDSADNQQPGAELPNPWSEVASAQDAADGAGFDSFAAAEGVGISLGSLDAPTYQSMVGVAEAIYDLGQANLCIRKGDSPDGADISGDYNDYAFSWTENVKGLEVSCFGDAEGAAKKAIWSLEGVSYAILVQGASDADAGLTSEDLAQLINASW